MFGERGHQRGRGGVGVFAPEQIERAPCLDDAGDVGGGPTGAGDAAVANGGLEEQLHGLLDGGDRVGGGPVVALQCALEQACPVGGGVGVFAEDVGGFGGAVGVGDPAQDAVDAVSDEGGGVEVAGDDFGCFGGVEPLSLIHI